VSLFDVRPSAPPNQRIYRMQRQASFIGQRLLGDASGRVSLTDSPHSGFGQFRACVGLALRAVLAGHSSLPMHVGVIVGWSAFEQMRRVATRWIVATVTDECALFQRSVRELVGQSMRTDERVVLCAHGSVASLIAIALPLPAFIRSAYLHAAPKRLAILQHRETVPDVKAFARTRLLSASAGACIWLHVMVSIVSGSEAA
jgi:hypothetical protein